MKKMLLIGGLVLVASIAFGVAVRVQEKSDKELNRQRSDTLERSGQ